MADQYKHEPFLSICTLKIRIRSSCDLGRSYEGQMSNLAQNPYKLYIAGFVMKNPVVWKGLKFYPTPRVGRSREKHIFVHQSDSYLFNMASKQH